MAGSNLKRADKVFLTKAAESGQLEVALAQLASQRASNSELRSFAQQLVNDHSDMHRQLEQLAASKGLQSDLAEYSMNMSGLAMAAMHGATGTSGSGAARSRSAGTTSSSTGEYDASSAASRSGAGATGASGTTGTAGASTGSIGSTGSTTSSSGGAGAGSSNLGTSRGPGDVSGSSSTSMASMANASDWNDPTSNRHYRRLAKRSGADFDKDYIAMMVGEHEADVSLFEKASKKAEDPEVRAFAEKGLPKLREHLQRAQQLATTVKS